MRLLICAGGTGGGVYPALAVHNALTDRQPGVETLWVGGEGGMEEELVKRAGIPSLGLTRQNWAADAGTLQTLEDFCARLGDSR